ncbi:MAG: nuclear transport factor 2 family protein [Pseudomonadota bacterium]
MAPQELVATLLTAVFVDYDFDAARALVTPDYIQHNPLFSTVAEGILGVIPIAQETGLTGTTHRLIPEGDFVVAHTTFENADAFGALSLELEFSIDPADIVVAGDMPYAATSSSGIITIRDTGQTVPGINRELWVFEPVEGDWKIAQYALNKSK